MWFFLICAHFGFTSHLPMEKHGRCTHLVPGHTGSCFSQPCFNITKYLSNKILTLPSIDHYLGWLRWCWTVSLCTWTRCLVESFPNLISGWCLDYRLVFVRSRCLDPWIAILSKSNFQLVFELSPQSWSRCLDYWIVIFSKSNLRLVLEPQIWTRRLEHWIAILSKSNFWWVRFCVNPVAKSLWYHSQGLLASSLSITQWQRYLCRGRLPGVGYFMEM